MRSRYSPIYILVGSLVVFSLILVGNGRLHGQSGDTTGTSVADPNSYIFQLKLGGLVVAEYTECTGLGSSNDISEGTTVTDAGVAVIQKTPGALRWSDIRLRRKGLTNDTVWSWRKAMENGETNLAFRDGAITLVVAGPTKQSVAQWTFRRGWVASLTFDGAMEEVVIVHQGLEGVTFGTAHGPATRS